MELPACCYLTPDQGRIRDGAGSLCKWSTALTSAGNGIRSIARNSVHLIARNLVVYVARFIYITICARFLGPEIYGLLVYGYTWYLVFLPFAQMGLQAAISRLVGRDNKKSQKLLAQTLSLRLIATILASVACGMVGWFISPDDNVRNIVLVFTLALAGRSISEWTTEVFNAFESSAYTLRQDSLFRIIEITVGLTILVTGGGVIELALLHGIVWWVQAARGLYIVHQRFSAIHLDLALNSLKPVIVMAFPFLLAGMFSSWVHQGPIILFRYAAGDDALAGEFALCMQIIFILFAMLYPVIIASLPVLSRSVVKMDGNDLVFADIFIRGAFLLGAAVGLAGMILAPLLVPLVFGNKYPVAAELLGPLLWCLVPYAVAAPLSAISIARGYFFIPVMGHLGGALVLTVSLPLLADRWGVTGGIAGTFFGFLVPMLVFLFFATKHDWLDFRKAVIRPLFVVILSIIVYFLAAGSSGWLALLAGLSVLVAGAVVFGVVMKDDLKMAGKVLNGTRKPRNG